MRVDQMSDQRRILCFDEFPKQYVQRVPYGAYEETVYDDSLCTEDEDNPRRRERDGRTGKRVEIVRAREPIEGDVAGITVEAQIQQLTRMINEMRRERVEVDAKYSSRDTAGKVRGQKTVSRRGTVRSEELKSEKRNDADDHETDDDDDDLDKDTRLPVESGRKNKSKIEVKDRKKMAIKPDRYDGKLPFCLFLAKFESCSVYNEWDDDDKAAHLRNSLTGVAAQVLWDKSGGQSLPYGQLKERLHARFGTVGQQEKFTAELRARKRKPNETLTELYHDVRMLMALAYPSATDERLSEVIARDHFLSAINDRVMEMRIRDRDPETLDDAFRISLKMEAYDNQKEEAALSENDKRRPTAAKYARMITGNSDQEPEVLDLIKQLTRKMESLEKTIARPNTEAGASMRTSPIDDARKKNEENNDASTTERPRRPPMRCYRCLGLGHIARNCRRKEDGDRPKVAEREDVKVISHDRGILATQATKDNYLAIEINGTKETCLLDTGSEVTVIPADRVKNLRIIDVDKRLYAANGTSIPIIGHVKVPMRLGREMLEIDMIATEHVTEIILGWDWLHAMGAIWNFQSGEIMLRGVNFPSSPEYRWDGADR